MLQTHTVDAPPQPDRPVAADVAPISIDDRLREFEAELIRWALRISRGNKSKAAQLLNIKRSTLGDRINRCGLGNGHQETSAGAMPERG